MGHLNSNVKKIADVEWRHIPRDRKICNVDKFCMYDGGLYFISKNGIFYTSTSINKSVSIISDSVPDTIVEVLVILGHITINEAEEHYKPRRHRNAVRHALAFCVYDIEKLQQIGIELTPAQKSKITRLKNKAYKNIADIPYYEKVKLKTFKNVEFKKKE